MRLIKTQKGFTIVETMIVIAVTGVLFVSTSLLISGQIAKAAFKDSALNMQQILSDSLNDVSAGYFGSSDLTIGCGSGVVGATNCIYIGKHYKIDKDSATIETSSLYADEDEDPFSPSSTTIKSTNEIVDTLPSGFDFTKDAEYSVLFEKYQTAAGITSDQTGAQTVGVYEGWPSGPFSISNKIVVCAKSGDREAQYILGENGSPTVKLEYKFTSGNCSD